MVIKVSLIIDQKDLYGKSREELFEAFCRCLEEASAYTTEAVEIDFIPLNATKKFLRTNEVAEAFQVSDRMVRKWCETGKVKALQTPGGGWRIPASQFTELDKVKDFQQTAEKVNQRFKDAPEIDEFEK